MKKMLSRLVIAAVLSLAAIAYAGNWSTPTVSGYNARLGTATVPDETAAPTNPTEGWELTANKPFVITVATTSPTYFSTGDAGHSGFLGDGGCVLDSFDGGCHYPAYPIPNDAGNHMAAPTTFQTGQLQAYLYSPATQHWNRAPTYDKFLTAGLTEQTFEVSTSNLPVGVGRITWVTRGTGIPVKIYVLSAK